MYSKINDILNGKVENSFYPFFWQHGETETVLRQYMEKIQESGMNAVCIEARPHPDFLGEKWWTDLDIILDEARKRDMKVWILDDSHFPTGYANGAIKEKYPEHRKWYLYMRCFDAAGPVKGARINISYLAGRPWDGVSEDINHVIGVYMAKRVSDRNNGKEEIMIDTLKDITGAYKDGIITIDIPEGAYRIFTVYYTRNGGEESTADYLNPLSAVATEVLVKTVYEPHYEKYKEDFGKTITGFFSDEPRFGNKKGFMAGIGQDMVLPWRLGLEKELPFEMKYLPLLWVQGEGLEGEIRYQYMNLITRLYHENFTGVLAKWCHDRGISYLGHNIEDNGAHARLGYGTGHYFRGQTEQDFSGIDVIGTQIVPGMPYHHDSFSTGGCDGEFYHFALAKLGASAAHLDPVKKGRAMCEAFGAYGWNEGLKLMKWITDHLIVRGINYLVPHAFSPKEFPDWDCPPHFYAQGHNPQFRYFSVYSNYANRLMNLFQNGVHKAPAAVLYPAEQEWAGDYMPVEKPVRELLENQIDCDIVSADYLLDAVVEENRLKIHKEYFKTLIIPYGEAIPVNVVRKAMEYAQSGLRVIFLQDYPSGTLGGELTEEEWLTLKQVCLTGAVSELADLCRDLAEIRLKIPYRELVYYHYEQGTENWMFFNEHLSRTVYTTIEMPEAAYAYSYDAFSNTLYQLEKEESGYRLKLAPYESCVWIFSEDPIANAKEKVKPVCHGKPQELMAEWKVSFADSFSYPDFKETLPVREVVTVNTIDGYEDKCGTVSYETVFTVEEGSGVVFLDLGTVYEIAEVFVNNKSAGVKLCPPYVFDFTGLVEQGQNLLRVEVTNTLGTQIRDGLSQYLVIEPFGVEGPVILYT